jgi:hypothetical protein
VSFAFDCLHKYLFVATNWFGSAESAGETGLFIGFATGNEGPQRSSNFYKDALLPAYARAGAGTIGLFSPETGFPSLSVPLIVLVRKPHVLLVDCVMISKLLPSGLNRYVPCVNWSFFPFISPSNPE